MNRLRVALLVLAVSAGSASAASPRQWTLTRSQWSGVTTAAEVVAIKPLHAAVAAFEATPGARLAVIHNGGEDGLFWAADLKGWLVALGIPSARIADHTEAIPQDEIRLRIEKPAGQ